MSNPTAPAEGQPTDTDGEWVKRLLFPAIRDGETADPPQITDAEAEERAMDEAELKAPPTAPSEQEVRKWTCSDCGATATYDEKGWLKCPCDCGAGGTVSHKPAEPTDLGTLLDRFQNVLATPPHIGKYSEMVAARTAITGYVSKIEEERSVCDKAALALLVQRDEQGRLASALQHETEIRDRQIAVACAAIDRGVEKINELQAEVARLREAALTRKDADLLLAVTEGLPEELNNKLIAIVESRPSTKPGESTK